MDITYKKYEILRKSSFVLASHFKFKMATTLTCIYVYIYIYIIFCSLEIELFK